MRPTVASPLLRPVRDVDRNRRREMLSGFSTAGIGTRPSLVLTVDALSISTGIGGAFAISSAVMNADKLRPERGDDPNPQSGNAPCAAISLRRSVLMPDSVRAHADSGRI